LRELPKKQSGLEIVFISHDAANAGAQRLLLTLIEWLRDKKGVQPKIVLRRGGPLVPEFYRLGPVFEMESSADWRSDQGQDPLVRFCKSASLIYVNTVVPGDVVKQLAELKIPIVTHAHEMENAIKRWCVNEQFQQLLGRTDHFVAASPPVASNLKRVHDVVPTKITTIYSFIECHETDVQKLNRTAIRKEKQLPEGGFIIFGCGTTDWRKGPDLFIEVASETKRLGFDGGYFFWIGGDTGEQYKLEARVRKLGLEDRVRFLGEVQDARSYFAMGDLFLLTSREDPFPLVCLEAADCGLPIVCFDQAGGMPDFVQSAAGYVVPFEDTKAMAEKVVFLHRNPEERARLGTMACEKVRARHDISIAGEEIFRIIDQYSVTEDSQRSIEKRSVGQGRNVLSAPKLSVIVPNYNHAPYLRQRLDSIIRQDFQDLEVIVLDDASSDGSAEIIQTYNHYPQFRFFFNEVRSGSAFKQWKRGLEEARGEYIWFAESDDYASPDFLSNLLPMLEKDKSIGLAYCQSYLVDPKNRILGDGLQWTDDLDPDRWRSDFVNDGKAEIRSYLSKKNTIPNASAVLIRASTLKSIDHLDDTYGLCGDWLLWTKLLLRSNLGYVAQKLNYWRQYSSNSRPHLPGITEWKEGQQIIRYVAEELGLSEAERYRLLLGFLERCFEWVTNCAPGLSEAGIR
jgi:glycosyltransferase involved in cell wall biosynthesis